MISLWVGVAAAGTLVTEWDFEAGSLEFVSSGVPAIWACGEVLSGPGQGSSGSSACGTGLATNYSNNSESYLTFPDFPLTGLTQPMIRWENWFAFEAGDFGLVESFVGGSWQAMSPVYGYPSGESLEGQNLDWHPLLLDLSSLTNLNQIRLRLSSDTAVTDDGWFIDEVTLWEGDVAPPQITGVTELPDTEDLPGPYGVSATVVDNQSLQSVELIYSVNGGAEVSIAMNSVGGDDFFAELPGQPHDSQVDYWVEALDGENEARYPAQGALEFRVRLPAPRDLLGPEGVVHATQATLSWTAPITALAVEAYWIYQADEFLMETTDLEADVGLIGGGEDRFFVTAIYEAGEGDPSGELLLDSAVPEVLEVDPQFVFQGDQIRAVVRGANLLFLQDDVDVALGQGIEVAAVDVRDVDTLIVRLDVAPDAVPGPRLVSVSSGELGASLSSALQVIDGKERPTVSRLEPPLGRQGSQLELEIYMLVY